MGLQAGGVRGVKLNGAADRVAAFALARPRSDLLVVAGDGKAKRTPLSEYPTQGRHGQGVLTARTAVGVTLAGGGVLQSGDPVVLVTEKGAAKTVLAKNAPRMKRVAAGRSIISLRKNDVVVDAFVPAAGKSDKE